MHKVRFVVDQFVDQDFECLLSFINRLLMFFKLKSLSVCQRHFLSHLLELPKHKLLQQIECHLPQLLLCKFFYDRVLRTTFLPWSTTFLALRMVSAP